MKSFCVLLVIAFIGTETFGFNLRFKRQDGNSNEEDLEDRYNPLNQRPINPLPGQRPLFPGQGQVIPTRPATQPPTQTPTQPPTQPPTDNGNGQLDARAIQNCIGTCPVTAEYRPVCGSNRVQYNNPGGLLCAQYCGVDVTLWRQAPCPTNTTPSPV